jgi:hypothetical protein
MSAAATKAERDARVFALDLVDQIHQAVHRSVRLQKLMDRSSLEEQLQEMLHLLDTARVFVRNQQNPANDQCDR